MTNVKSAKAFPELVPPSGGAAAEPKSLSALIDEIDFLPALAFVAGAAVVFLALAL